MFTLAFLRIPGFPFIKLLKDRVKYSSDSLRMSCNADTEKHCRERFLDPRGKLNKTSNGYKI